MCNKKTDLEPIRKRPIGLFLIIVLLAVVIPLSAYEIVFGNNEYPVISLIIDLFLAVIGIGLWYKKEIARRVLLTLVGLLLFPGLFSLFYSIDALDKGIIQSTEIIPTVISVLLLVVTFFYLRSVRLLRYYWADNFKRINT